MKTVAFGIKVCCFCNRTNKLLYLHFNSRYGAVEAYVPEGVCTYFNYFDDGKQRVMSAFDEDNELVMTAAFKPQDKNCYLVQDGSTAPVRDSETFEPPVCTTVPI